MIRNYVVLFLLLFTTTLQSQNVFRMVTDGPPVLEVTIDDSTYQVVVNLLSDITGGSTSYYASGIQTGYQLFTASFQLYDITSVVPDGLFQARLIIRRVNNDIITTNGPPASQAMVFFPLSTDKLPQVPFSSIAAGPSLQEKISTYNALVSAISGNADDWGNQSVESDPTLLGTGVTGDVLKADTTILSTKYYTQTQRDSAYTWSNTYTDTTLASAEALIYDSIGQVASQISTLNTTIIDSTASALNQAQLYADSLSTAPAGGDLSGNYPNPTVVGIQTIPVSPATPINGQGFVYQNGQWVIGNFDPSSTNELQTLYFDPISDSLFLSNGNSVHIELGKSSEDIQLQYFSALSGTPLIAKNNFVTLQLTNTYGMPEGSIVARDTTNLILYADDADCPCDSGDYYWLNETNPFGYPLGLLKRKL